jgi:hypothetical protein
MMHCMLWLPACCRKMDGNYMTGTLPNEWSGMLGMEYLDLAQNGLTGTIPASWRNMARLKTLWVAGMQRYLLAACTSGCCP